MNFVGWFCPHLTPAIVERYWGSQMNKKFHDFPRSLIAQLYFQSPSILSSWNRDFWEIRSTRVPISRKHRSASCCWIISLTIGSANASGIRFVRLLCALPLLERMFCCRGPGRWAGGHRGADKHISMRSHYAQELDATAECWGDLSTHRGRWIEQQGARLSPRGLLPLQQACERPLCWSADRHRRVELWCAQGATVALQGRPSSEYQAHLVLSWIFSPGFESRKTGQRGIMRKNRLLCNECPAHTFQSIHDVRMIEWRRYQCYIKVWKILQNKYQMV